MKWWRVVFAAMALGARVAEPGTFDARLAWLPSPNQAVVDYHIYHDVVRGLGRRHREPAIDAGLPSSVDGAFAFVVPDLDPNADHRFVVTAVTDDGGESRASNGLVLVGGGTCSVPVAQEARETLPVASFAVRRIEGEPVLVARASFPARGARLDAFGARLAVQGPDGVVLYKAAIPASAFGARGVYQDAEKSVTFRRGRRRARLWLRAVVPDLAARPRGPLTWVVAVGRSCVRNRHVRVRGRS